MDVSKSVALVTGGARGLGKEIVAHLLEKRAKVSIVDILEKEGKELEKECQNKYGSDRVKFMKCDVTDSQQLSDVFDLTKSTFGSLDIVCNNAGIGEMNPKLARKQILINLVAVVEGTYKAIEMMSTKNGGKGGVVVNTASTAGLRPGTTAPVYAASKYGVVGFTRSMTGYAREGVRVNCICPYCVDTDLLNTLLEPSEKQKVIDANLLVDIADIPKAVMRCVSEDGMSGTAIAILPGGVIRDVEFPEMGFLPANTDNQQ